VILGAALLVLVALALFVGGIATGATALYYACIAVALVAAVLLFRTWWAARTGAPAASRAGAGTPAGAPAIPAARAAEPASAPPPPGPPPVRQVTRETEPDGGETRVTPQDDVAPGRAVGHPSGATSVTDGTAAQPPAGRTVDAAGDDPPVEEVEVTDLLLVMDLRDDVVVVDEHPRYHLAECPWLRGRTPIPLPIDEARTDGFTPCAVCEPDRHLAAIERARRGRRGTS
jgi:hypothetical protein